MTSAEGKTLFVFPPARGDRGGKPHGRRDDGEREQLPYYQRKREKHLVKQINKNSAVCLRIMAQVFGNKILRSVFKKMAA